MVAKLLAPFEKKTGIKVVHTIVPWTVEGATYATNYAGPNPFDVSYQTSTDLTGLGTKGVLEVLTQLQGLELPAPAWEERVLPARVARYDPADLEHLCLSGVVAWGRLRPPVPSEARTMSGPAAV